MRLRVFDPNITRTSPAGSCVLTMLQAARESYQVELFASRTDLTGVAVCRIWTPLRPVFLQSILFTCGSVVACWMHRRRPGSLSIGTQGGFPFCQLSYAHCCHKLFLTRYRRFISGGWLTRTARLVNHAWGAAMEAIAFRCARVIVAPSAGLAQELTDAYGSAVAGKLKLIANPVDCARFAPEREHERDAEFSFAFCALGNFDWKGLPLVLEALARGVPGRLKVIGGTAQEMAHFQRMAEGLGVAQRVNFVGLQSDVRRYLWGADAFVFPSVYETFPLVCLQAAAAGLALIATDLYGLERLLQPGVSGWRVERRVESIGSAMTEAASDRRATRTMGQRAQALAEEYDVAVFQRQWMDLLARMQTGQARVVG